MGDPSARAGLYSALSGVIGTEHAGVLMSYLPSDEPATQADLVSTTSQMTSEIDLVRSDLTAQIDLVRSDLTAQIDVVRSELSGQIETLTGRVDGLDHRMERFEDKLDGFHEALLTQGRTYMISTLGSVISVAGIVTAITRLL